VGIGLSGFSLGFYWGFAGFSGFWLGFQGFGWAFWGFAGFLLGFLGSY
jgi:hypothetical protein